jgi:hypothetical protein
MPKSDSLSGLAPPGATSAALPQPEASILREANSTAVGRARVAYAVAGWQGATTRWAHAREADQRRQRAVALLNRGRSAFTQKVMGFG